MYKKIILFGAKGFIGQALLAGLGERFEIAAFDLPEADITQRDVMMRLATTLGEKPKTVVINAAGLMNAQESRRKPDLYYLVNGTAVKNVLLFCAAIRASGFVHLSSETVFGSGDAPFAEDGPRIPIHPYGISKLIGELVIRDHESAYPCSILRLPVVVGTGQAVGNPISIFCEEAMREGKITLFNGGGHRRKFVAVGDVVGQVGAMLDKGLPDGTGAYNMDGVSAAMREIAAAVAARLGNVAIADQTSANQAFTLLSSSEKINHFGYRLRYDLTAMIELFLKAAN